jgi:hypothetical protein
MTGKREKKDAASLQFVRSVKYCGVDVLKPGLIVD